MMFRWSRNPVMFILTLLVLALLLAVACGDSATATPRAAATAAPATTAAPAPATAQPTATAAAATQAPIPTAGAQQTQYSEAAKLLMEGGPLALAAANGETPRYGGKFLTSGPELIPSADMHQTSFGGVYVITAKGLARDMGSWDEQLYRPRVRGGSEEIEIRAVPYAFWGNRGVGKMIVWLDTVF